MKSQWFVIHTLSGQEQRVRESIEKRLKTEEMEDFIREVLVPIEKVVEVRNGKKTVTSRKLYPGYVFVDMLLLDENRRRVEKPWYFIKDTPGVIGFVGGDNPSPSPAEEIDASYDGVEMTVAFNPDYLSAGIDAIDSDDVTLATMDPMKPAVLRGVGRDDYLYLLMPVRVP
jgi:transcription antitermination factor NusG